MANKFNSARLNAFVNTGVSLFLLRVFSAGMLFYYHGYGKLVNVFTWHLQFADPIGIGPGLSLVLAAFAEGICTIFLIFGLYTRLASFLLIINFVVAYYAASKELALLYLACFIVIFLIGPGKFSVDYSIRR